MLFCAGVAALIHKLLPDRTKAAQHRQKARLNSFKAVAF
jgi:hypothetical protein